jgi:flagellar FliL protein
MAKKKKAEGEEEKAKGGGLKKLAIPVVALALGAFVGPKFLGGGASGEAAAATTTTTAPGPVITLEPITLNLTDGHLLKLGLALQISAEWLHEHGGGGGGGGHGGEAEVDTSDPTRGYARALDAAIGVFSARSMPELMDNAGREAARTALTIHLEEAYHGEIEGVYLYEFVMQ